MKRKSIVVAIMGSVLGIGGISTILNKDFNPFIRTAKSQLKDRILALVNERTLTLERAREAVVTAERNIIDLNRKKARLDSMKEGLVGKVSECRSAARSCKNELSRLQSQLVAGGEVFTSTGKALSRGELGSTIDFQTRELKRIESREKSLTTLLEACSSQLDRMTLACEQAPLKLRSVIAMCSDLESKTQLAVEMQHWSEQMAGELTGSVEGLDAVEESLTKISADLDGEIAGLGTLMNVHSDLRGGNATSTDDLLAKIQSALGDDAFSSEFASIK